MLKTEQARTAALTARLDKPVNQRTLAGNKRKPQYLDVALARDSDDLKVLKDRAKNAAGKNVKKESEELGFKRGRNKVNALSGKNVNTSVNNDQKVNTAGNKTFRKLNGKGGGASPDRTLTFKEKQKFESEKNQKLYEELDQMLSGRNGVIYPKQSKEPELSGRHGVIYPKQSKEPEFPVKVTKGENITLVTRRSLYPGISKESRDKHDDSVSIRHSTVPAKESLGYESAILHQRELKAEKRLEKLDKIDDFSLGDFTVKTQVHDSIPRASGSEGTGKAQTVTVGIPVHAGNTFSRRHIVADVPVYLPTFAGGNQPFQPVVKETGPVPVDKVYESTIPGAAGKQFQTTSHFSTHAPEAFIGPVPGLNTVVAETQGGAPVLNTYRSTGNPISERLLKEQAEREKSLIEKSYFDIPQEDSPVERTSVLNVKESQESDKKSIAGTLISDPGPRRTEVVANSDENRRLSPEGYLAQKERQARLEKEARILKKAEGRKTDSEGEVATKRSVKADHPLFENQYQVDFYAQKTRSEIRSSINLVREDSWIKRQLEKPSRSPIAMDTYRGEGGTYRASGYGNETYRGGQGTYRDFEQGTYRLNDQERNVNRSYRLPDSIRERDRYNDQAKGSYGKEFQYDERYERERLDYSRDRDPRGYERNEKNRGNYEKDSRSYERDKKFNEQDIRVERDRREFLRDERGPVSSRYESDRRDFRKDESLRYEPAQRDPRLDRHRLIQNEKDESLRYVGPTQRDPRFDRQKLIQNHKDFNKSDDPRTYASQKNERDDYNRRPSMDKEDKKPLKSPTKDEKVQYVIKNKSESSKTDMRKSEMSVRSDPLPENVAPPSTELRERSPKSQYSRKSYEGESQSKNVPPAYTRQTPIGQEKSKVSMNESKETAKRLPTYETKIEKDGNKSAENLEKYFDEPDRPGSHSNVIPFYSDSVNKYSKPKHDFRNGELMTPVQEMSIKLSEDDDRDGQSSKTDKGSDKDKQVEHPGKNERVKFLSSNENKHEIQEDRRSPWRKDDTHDSDRRHSLKDEPPKHLIERQLKSPDISKIKGPDSVEQIKQRIREKTMEKIEERQQERRRERTLDSQGPTDNKDEVKADEIDIDDLNLDDVQTEMDEKELYVCYLVTDNGEKIGPMRLDINDVQIGLPNPDKMKDIPEQTGEVEDEGMRNRQTGSHGLNEFSSRSHSMLMLTIDSEMQDPEDENLYITKRGKLTFVDLAGSEKVKDSNSTADTLVESNSINKSLLVLGNCISSLGDHKRRQGHIPYRDSKLTKLLADSLGGNGVTLMICCITPSSYHAPETMNTLRYASRAKKIRTKPVIKMDPREKLILSLKREIKILRNENHYLRQQMGIPTKNKPKPASDNDDKKANEEVPKRRPDSENIKKPSDVIKNYGKDKEPLEFPAKPKGQIQKENDQKFVKIMKETNGKPETNNTVNTNDEKLKQNGNAADESGLYEMLQEYMVENEALRTENAEMQVHRDKVRQDQQTLYRDNEKLMRRVDELERRLGQATASWQSMPRQDSHRSRDHSPRGSPQYNRGGGSGGKVMQAKFPQPPTDLPLRDNPALRDPVYPGSPPQGYNSPTSNGRPKPAQPPPRGQPQPLKPPHRLVEPIPQQRPVYEQNGPPYMNGHAGAGHGYPAGNPAMQPGPGHHPGSSTQYRQPIGSPNRPNDLRMDSRKSSTSSSSDAIRDMNDKLRQELMQLDGQIHNHQMYSHPRNQYGSQGSMR